MAKSTTTETLDDGHTVAVAVNRSRVTVHVRRPSGTGLPLYDTLELSTAEARALMSALIIELA